MHKYHDKKTSDQPVFRIGDKGLLSARNVKTKRPSKKLDQLFGGPCTIVRAVGNRAFELKLPPLLKGKMHNVFHVVLLEPFIENSIEGRAQPPDPPVGDDLDYYVISKVVDSRKIYKTSAKVYY